MNPTVHINSSGTIAGRLVAVATISVEYVVSCIFLKVNIWANGGTTPENEL